MSTKTAYPLCWPTGWPKTAPERRERGAFKTELAGAMTNLRKQIDLMGGKNLLLSSNYTLGVERPKDSGVVAYFLWNDLDVAIPCDRWQNIGHNVQAIALTIEAMRGMERWGAKHMIRAMFTGFKALPAPETDRPWWEVLDVGPKETAAVVIATYRKLVMSAHPDQGGTHERFVAIQKAYDDFKRERGL